MSARSCSPPNITDTAFRAAVESAWSYQEAATALGMEYQALYRRARKLGVGTRHVQAMAAALPPPSPPRPPQPAPSPLISFVEHPAPEPAPPTLTDWRPPPAEYVRTRDPGRSPVLEVRLDQYGRVRAQISKITDDDSEWVCWETFDCTGQRVDKPGIDGELRTARDRVDRRLVRFGWLSVDRIGASASGVAAPVVLEPSAVAVLRRAAEQILCGPADESARAARDLARLVVGVLVAGRTG